MLLLTLNFFLVIAAVVLFSTGISSAMLGDKEIEATDTIVSSVPSSHRPMKKKHNSLRVHFPYDVFRSDVCDWRNCKGKSQLSPHYFNYSRSQDQEDIWLYENWFFNIHGGVVMESGALDGLKYSNTYLFSKIGQYMAIHIEADPRNYFRLVRNRPESINIHAALCSESKLLHFTNDKGSEVQGFVEFMSPYFLKKFHNKIYKQKIPLEDLPTVKCVPINAILREFNVSHIDIWILDIEGAELSVLKGFDFSLVSISAIVMESDDSNVKKDEEKLSILRTNGYTCQRIQRNHFCRHEKLVPSPAPINDRRYTGARIKLT